MIDLRDAKVFTFNINLNGVIVTENQNILSYFSKNNGNDFKKFILSLTSSISIIKTVLTQNNIEYVYFVSGYRIANGFILNFYREEYFDNSDLQKQNGFKNTYSISYNLSTKKVLYIKNNNIILALNNKYFFDVNILNNIKIDSNSVKKISTCLEEAISSLMPDSKYIQVNYNGNLMHFYICIKKEVIQNNHYLNIKLFELKFDNEVIENTVDKITGLITFDSLKERFNKNPNKFINLSMVLIKINNLDKFSDLFGYNDEKELVKYFSKLIKNKEINLGILSKNIDNEFLLITKNSPTIIENNLKNIYNEINKIFLKKSNFILQFTSGLYKIDNGNTIFEKAYECCQKAFEDSKQKNKLLVVYNPKEHYIINLDNLQNRNVLLNISNQNSNKMIINKVFEDLINFKTINEITNKVLNDLQEYYHGDRIAMLLKINGVCYERTICLLSNHSDASISTKDITNAKLQFNNNIYIGDENSINSTNKHICIVGDINIQHQIIIKLNNVNIEEGYIVIQSFKEKIHWESDIIPNLLIICKVTTNLIAKIVDEQLLEKEAYFDVLTGYWNLNKLTEIITEKNPPVLYLMSIDIDKFRYINNNYGYAEGDKVLKDLATFLKNNMTDDEYFCRLGDDKFIFIICNDNENRVIGKFNFINNFINDYSKEKYGKKISIKAGYIKKIIDESISEAIYKANKACEIAKKDDKTVILAYTNEIGENEKQHKLFEERLDLAIENKEFIIYLQPCMNIKNKKIKSAEALVRWNCDGVIKYPDSFIPILEKNNKIIEMDFLVYEQVCKYLSYLKKNKLPMITISVNVSRCHFLSKDFLEKIKSLLIKYNIQSKYICLEITESAFVSSLEELIKFVVDLKNCGFKIYIDDFGIAYSNISFLGQIPVDVLKIDKGFLDHKITKKEYIILKNIVRMAKELGIRVLCEGIEGKIELSIAKNIGCDYVQGYYYDRPIPLDKFTNKYISRKVKYIN